MSPVFVRVCSACKRASCWQGALYCDDYKRAGSRLVDVKVLRELALEDPGFWEWRP